MSSETVFAELQTLIPGGVNSPFRAFRQVGGDPPILARGRGSRVWDLEGREYLDLVGGWGPLLMGHGHPRIVQAVREAAEDGTLFGASTEWELHLARRVREAMPSVERVRFVNSGAEAVGSALRVARSARRRPRIVKFEGCYHGHVECLDAAGLEAEEAGGPLALGASPGAAAETLVARFNDLGDVERVVSHHGHEVAALLVEPVTGSMGVIPPEPGFLEGLREICDRTGILLIFDEVLTGFRVARGGAQARYGVRPDLTCLGKALSGGLPMGAYGGRRDLMDQVAPEGPVYQAGTYCGNPVSVRAAVAALDLYAEPGLYDRLERLSERLVTGLRGLGGGLLVQSVGSMVSLGFGPGRLRDHRDARRLDLRAFAAFFQEMLARGIYLPPSTHDAACLSAVHTEEEVDRVVEAAGESLQRIASWAQRS